MSFEESNNISNLYTGEVSALKSNEFWEAQIYAAYNKPHGQGFDILIRKYNESNFLRKSIFIYKVPLAIGNTPIKLTSVRSIVSLTGVSYATSLADVDVSVKHFIIRTDDSFEDYIEITE